MGKVSNIEWKKMARKNSATNRIVDPRGYVLVYVGKSHHLADVRGYAYEHRIVAERKLNRKLQPGEMVHHIDRDRGNNTRENLEIVHGNGEHMYRHRSSDSNRRKPREPNPIIICACGCGSIFSKFDSSGRPRRFVSGHNPMPSPAQTEILRVLENGSIQRNQIARLCEKSIHNIAVTLSRLKQKGLVIQTRRGTWALRETIPDG